jgi:hypothetical protein
LSVPSHMRYYLPFHLIHSFFSLLRVCFSDIQPLFVTFHCLPLFSLHRHTLLIFLPLRIYFFVKDWSLLGYSPVKSSWSRPTFQRRALPPSSSFNFLDLSFFVCLLVPFICLTFHYFLIPPSRSFFNSTFVCISSSTASFQLSLHFISSTDCLLHCFFVLLFSFMSPTFVFLFRLAYFD